MNEGGKLSNKAGVWEHENKLWIFDQGVLLESNSRKALSLINGGTSGTRVILEKNQVAESGTQQWTKGILDQGGWFPLKNSQYGGYLTAQNNYTTIISGKPIQWSLVYTIESKAIYYKDSIGHFSTTFY